MFAPQLAVYGVFDTPQDEETSVSMSDAMRSFLSSDAADDVTSSFFLMKIEREQRERDQVAKDGTSPQKQHISQGGMTDVGKPHQASRFGLASPRKARQPQASSQTSMDKSLGSYDLPSFPSSVVGQAPGSCAPMPTYTIREPHVSEEIRKKKTTRTQK
jgi:hypothetical protein